MIDIILGLVIAVSVGAAIAYMVRAKRRGAQCIGCPHAGACCAAGKNGRPSGEKCRCDGE